jgi:putative oxidoreductase
MSRFLDQLQPLGLLVMRLVLGVIMVGHGFPKVFGGLHHHVQFVASLGLPGWWAYLSAASEFFGGLVLIAGLGTRIAAALIAIDLGIAIWKVHWAKGLLAQSGYQFPLALATLAFALIFFGSGPISLDWVLARRGGGGGPAPKST